MKARAIAAALLIMTMIPGAQAGAAGTGTVLGATQPPATESAQPTPEASAQPNPYLALDEFILALGMEPPLGDIDSRAAQALHGFYLSVSDLLDRARLAIPESDDLIDPMTLISLEREADALDEDMEAFEDTLKATYRAGGISRDAYGLYDNELEYMEDVLDCLEDVLDVVLDDDDDDDDDYFGYGLSRVERMRSMAELLRLEYPRTDTDDDFRRYYDDDYFDYDD